MQAMMQMVKLDIAGLKNAYEASQPRDPGGLNDNGGCTDTAIRGLALQLPFPKISESMGNHDSRS